MLRLLWTLVPMVRCPCHRQAGNRRALAPKGLPPPPYAMASRDTCGSTQRRRATLASKPAAYVEEPLAEGTIEAGTEPDAGQVLEVDAYLRDAESAQDAAELPNLVTAPYLSPAVRRRLMEAGIGYIDETGNIRISLAEPGLFIEANGASRDPNPEGRPSRSLAGAKAGRIIRALCTHRVGWGVRAIADATETNQ